MNFFTQIEGFFLRIYLQSKRFAKIVGQKIAGFFARCGKFVFTFSGSFVFQLIRVRWYSQRLV